MREFKNAILFPSLKIAIIYTVIGLLYIFFSDKILYSLIDDPKLLTHIQTIKGFAFVVLSALLILYLSYMEIRKKHQLIGILNNSNNWYSVLTNNLSGVNVYLFDEKLKCILATGPEADRLNLPHSYFAGKKFYDINYENVVLFEDEKLLNYLREFKSFNEEVKKEDKFFDVKGFPIFDEKNKLTSYIIISYNITEQKMMVGEMKDSRNKYKRLYKEYLEINEQLKFQNKKIKEINVELKVAKEKAQQSDKMKSAFLANISHEIRTPMNAILGFSNLLNNDNLISQDRNKYTQIVKTGINQLLSIIDDLIEISRIESGLVEANPKQFSLNNFMNEILGFLKDHLKSSNKDVEAKMSSLMLQDKMEVVGDKQKIHQIFENILSNAVKFTKSGKIELGCTVKNESEIEFFVKDTGVGIDKSQIESITQPFVKNENDSFAPGVGIGLSIVKGLLKVLNGHLEIESELNKGSTFFFTIPLEFKEQSDAESLFNTQKFKDKKILVIEDQDSNMQLLSELLEPLEFNLIRATFGQKALEEFNNNEDIDLILLDLKLPDINGLDLAEVFKTQKPDLPIIIQSAYVDSENRKKSLDLGCDDFLTKPLNFQELLLSLHRHLSK